MSVEAATRSSFPILMLQTDVLAHPRLGPWAERLFDECKNEGAASRGIAHIAPNLFVGSDGSGYLHYNRYRKIVLVYAYTGPDDRFDSIASEFVAHCDDKGYQLNFLSHIPIASIGSTPFTATPFGVVQRINDLPDFSLEGGAMRRLRNQLYAFAKSGDCRLEEYICGSDPAVAEEIAHVIDKWCARKTKVNPLVRSARQEILDGTLHPRHRLFITRVDGVLQNAILISPLRESDNGYLMDLEFYGSDMPRGGLEFAIVGIIEKLRAEGRTLLSLGGTYGCRIEQSPIADPGVDKILDDLHTQGIFNDQGNFQFKNKFRPDARTIFLCRKAGCGNPDSVIDIIMMIADPSRTRSSEAENHTPLEIVETASWLQPAVGGADETAAPNTPDPADPSPPPEGEKKNPDDSLSGPFPASAAVVDGRRARALASARYNPGLLTAEDIDHDLRTDSWAQLSMPAIDARMRELRGRLQEPVDADACVRRLFPFAHFVYTESGRTAEQALYRAWPRKGAVYQNPMFPTNIANQIGNDFVPRQIAVPAFYAMDQDLTGRSDLDLDALRTALDKDPAALAMVCVELSDNAAGGQPVSIEHLRAIRAMLSAHGVPLVVDATRVLENARFLLEADPAHASAQLQESVRALLACADTVVASLPKDFCLDRGGLIATNDTAFHRAAQEAADRAGSSLDALDRRLVGLAMRDRAFLESRLVERMNAVRRIWTALRGCGAPVIGPPGAHCVLVDVARIPEFSQLEAPVASFLAWLYLETGIRAAAHNTGLRRRPEFAGLVRLALPMGLDDARIEAIETALVRAFGRRKNIPELAPSQGSGLAFGEMNTEYTLKTMRNPDPAETAVSLDEASGNGAADAPIDPSDAVAEEVVAAGDADDATEEAGADAVPPAPMAERRIFDIAVVGMAGRYPKARNIGEFWVNLKSGRDCIEDLPQDRYEQRLRYGPAARYRGGFIDDVDKFDSLFFNIPPKDAERLDPQERLFVEVAWETLEDAGYYPESLGGGEGSDSVGVYVGAVWAMYQTIGVEEKHCGGDQAPNSFLWSIANRVSYAMNLSGPSLTVDTACSSSLTALYLACEALYAGECGSAIVGGVNLDLHQSKWDINLSGGALSKDGVCRSFGQGANGYVAGEGVGAVYIKPLAKALADGDRVYGVIKSAVVNHGGRTSGFVVPNPKAQTNLVREAMRRAGVSPASIGYIEAHGTGTELGDPLEISALNNAFRDSGLPVRACSVGSLKSNIGHLEAAAGVASLTKVLLQMRHRQLVPSLHSAVLNEHIDFERSPFRIQQELEPWTPMHVDGTPQPLRAGISSFGAGGANAHVVVESWEAVPSAEPEAPPASHIIPLSARNEAQLAEAARRLRDFVESADPQPSLRDVAFTLQIGRKGFEHRVCFVARSHRELIARIDAFLGGRRSDGVFAGNVKNADAVVRLMNRSEREQVIGLLARRRDPGKLARLWVDGLLHEWRGSSVVASGVRISLPTYPFADKRHWVPISIPNGATPTRATAAIHPLVDSNESTFEKQVFRKSFHNGEFFIYDHLVMDVPTLPGVAYLELARKAGELAADLPVRKLHNIVWVSPIAVKGAEASDAWIELKPANDGVRFEVFGDVEGRKILHSQGRISYAADVPEDEHLDLDAIRSRCEKVIEGRDAYPLFKAFGLNLGPSFQSLQEVYRGPGETLGRLKLPESRLGDLTSMLLHPSLVDGSLQAGVAAQLGDSSGDMLVPFSIGEVEVLHPLPAECWSHVTEMTREGAETSRVSRKNVTIVDATGKVLVRIKEATGVPIAEVHKSAEDDGFSKLFYSPEWIAAPLSPSRVSLDRPSTGILLFDEDAGLRDACRAAFDAESQRHRILLARPASAFAEAGADGFEFDPADIAQFERVIASAMSAGTLDAICIAWPLRSVAGGDASLEDRLERSVYATLGVCQALSRMKLQDRIQVIFLHAIVDGRAAVEHEAIAGLFRAMHLEFPKVRCRVLGLAVSGDDAANALQQRAGEILRDETRDDAAEAVAVRHVDGERQMRSLRQFPLLDHAKAADASHLPRDEGVYLITGGAGGLGLIFAEDLARRHRARLVLTGRSPLSPAIDAACAKIAELGGEAVYLAADIADIEDTRRLVERARERFGAINGVIHSAGVLRDSYVRNKTREDFEAVLAPKVRGTHNLDECTRDEPLDFFVLFSSMAAIAGNAGQSDYGYANHYMDSFAFAREALRAEGQRKGRTLSLNWSLWADGGMRVDEQTEQMFKTLGMKLLPTDTGTTAMLDALASEVVQLAVLEGVRDKIELAWGLRKKPQPAAAPAAPAAAAGGAPGTDLAALVQERLTRIAMEFLKLEAEDISPDSVLLDLGFDSIGLTTYANSINDAYGVDVTPVLFFDYPSIREVSAHLAAERREDVARAHAADAATADSGAAVPSASASAPAAKAIQFGKGWNPASVSADAPAQTMAPSNPQDRFAHMPIAIVGMSGVMPQSDDLREFWEHLRNGDDLITVIPEDRWDWEEYFGDPFKEANKSNSKWGGFMKEVDKFDALFFGISKREAQMMDPQQRIFLETVWKAIEDSGHRVSDFSGTRTGLFVGAATNDYVDLMNRLDIDLDGYSASGNSHSVLANRVSFLLNLRGPSAPIDTACSSSLVAMHRAIESIHTGSCDMAIVGGVQVMISPAAYISFGMAGMLSNDGKCKTFDKRADGYVRGEGVGAVVLKPLDKAESDGDHVYAVVRATAENHGGKVTTLTAPNSAAQAELLIEAYEKAKIDPVRVGYIECHGTGTGLGDPIEIQALSKAFAELYKRRGLNAGGAAHCGLSSAKTNIGHLETAAGIAGILRVLLAIRHTQIPANVHFQELNPYIKLTGTPFYIVDKTVDWTSPLGPDGRPAPRVAGVSSFGFGGANAHVVLEEYLPQPRTPIAAEGDDPQLIVLSAKAQDRLKAYAESMSRALAEDRPDFGDFAYTLQVGRDEMTERLAFVAGSVEETLEKFRRYLEGAPAADIFVGSVRSAQKNAQAGADPAAVRALIDRGALSDIAALWTGGTDIDWNLLKRRRRPQRLPLPTYPFARERCWIPVPEAAPRAAPAASSLPSPPATVLRSPSRPEPASAPAASIAAVVPQTLFFLPEWRETSIDASGPQSRGDGAILLFARNAGIASSLRARFAAAGATVPRIVVVVPGESYECTATDAYALRPQAAEDYRRLVDDLAGARVVFRDVVHAWSGLDDAFDRHGLETGLQYGVASVFSLIQAIASPASKAMFAAAGGPPRLLHFYGNPDDRAQPHHAAINALFTSAALEVPGIVLLSVECAPQAAAGGATGDSMHDPMHDPSEIIFDELIRGKTASNWVRRAAGRRSERKFAKSAIPPRGDAAVREHGVYVITGGAGGLGLLFASYLSSLASVRIALLGRSEADRARLDAIAAIEARGSKVLYLRCDVSDEAQAFDAIRTVRESFGRIDGVIHAAGAILDAPFADKTWGDFETTLKAKVSGAINIDKATREDDLDYFAMFSSVASVLGSSGQSDYAYANGFLDSFAAMRESLVASGARRGKSLSIGWPLWRDGGMRPEKIKGIKLDENARLSWQKFSGIHEMETDAGLTAFESCLLLNQPSVTVMYGDEAKLSAMLGIPTAAVAAVAPRPANDVRSSVALDSGELDRLLRKDLLQTVSDILLVEPSRLLTDIGLNEYGLDSIGVANLIRRVNETYGCDLVPAILFQYPTFDAFAGYLLEEHRDALARHYADRLGPVLAQGPDSAKAPPSAAAAEPRTLLPYREEAASTAGPNAPAVRAGVAIVGIGAILPGSDSVDGFWRTLIEGSDPISEIPRDRWDWRQTLGHDDRSEGTRWGGFLADVDRFDADFFEIPPAEAALMDPQQRLFLQATWNAIEDSGHRASELAGTRTAVFVGVSGFDYSEVIRVSGIEAAAKSATGVAHCLLPNRISYLLDLRGPSEAIDTACSSSLVAVHRAAESIAEGDCPIAIAGGVNLMLTPSLQAALASAGMLSASGRCRTFDQAADGYVRSEGCVAVVLKRLDIATADGDAIYGVIEGSAVNHGGRAMGLTAPNPNAQSEVLVDAYRRAGIDPEQVGLIETHGTGTPMGDAVELNGLIKAFRELGVRDAAPSTGRADRENSCFVSSVKTNIGHLEAASGIASLVKVLLCIRNRRIPGILHYERTNPQIRLEGSRFRIADETREWRAFTGPSGESLPLTAGISSFGFGGVNVHLVVREHVPAGGIAGDELVPAPARLFVLSAKNREQLRRRASDLADHLDSKGRVDARYLQRVAYTLQVGRNGMQHRLGLRAESASDLLAGLRAFAATGEVPANARYGVADRESDSVVLIDRDLQLKRQIVSKWLESDNLGAILELWSKGVDVDWADLYRDGAAGAVGPTRVNLPGYPFARVRHWVDTLDGAAPVVDQSTPEQSARAGIVPGVPKIAPRIVSSNAADIASRLICEILARQLDCHPDSLAADRTLLELGVVSSGIASLVREINAELDLDLSPSALFEYPTIARLADHLQQTAPDALRRHRGTSAETVAATDLVAKALPDDVVYAPDVDPALAQKVLWTESAPDAEEYERLTF